MPALGLTATWGAQDWASYVLEHLSAQSVLLRAGARVVPVGGRIAHIPRVLTDGTATWTAEGTEIDSSAPTGDTLDLTPKKLANVVSLSRESVEDSPIGELDAVGIALTRSIATAIDVKAFSADAATALAPAGLRSVATDLPTAITAITIDAIITAVGVVEAVGAIANAIFINPTDLTALRLVKTATGSNQPVLQPDLQAGGAERLAGAILYSTPGLPAGVALVGDAAQIVVGIRRAIEVAFSSDALFTADSIAARVTARADWGVNDERGLVLLKAA
jgi:HK97 family phage major capsid protein